LPAELFAIGRYVRSTARQTETKRRLRVHDPHRFIVYPPGHNTRIVKIWDELPARGLPGKSVRKLRCDALLLMHRNRMSIIRLASPR
jgi:hypothetical protein